MVLLIRALPLLFLLFLLSALPAAAEPPPEASPDNPYLAELLENARRAELHDAPYWHTLLHYKRGLFGLRSLVDDPDFFLAPDGKHDPRAELEATLRAFFLPPPEEGKHPLCRFVARYHWLKERLSIDESRLPVPGCEPFERLMEEIRPESVTLVFPTSHMNSPASMYGHTLLAVETSYKSDLLSYAVNYSAITNETFGPFYIVKGLFGMYEGYFSILPYYAKLQEYGDVNDRDIWEYPLDLSGAEIRRLMMHIYELEDIYSDYYFFNENCSYDLLFLLDAARPGLDLTDRTGWWVIPIDTIREIERAGLFRSAAYRPSKSTKIKYLASLLSREDRREARAIAGGGRNPEEVRDSAIPDEEKITILDLAGEILQYRYMGKEIPKEIYQKRFLNTLRVRSVFGDAEAEERYAIPAPPRPDDGHRSNRLALGGGAVEERTFWEVRLRPAYHDLLDNEDGYKKGSQIIFGEAVVRYDPAGEKARLHALDLIDIVSIAPRDEFFKHTSWKIRTGFFRRTMENGRDYVVYDLNPGFGRAYDGGFPGIVYGMIETDLHVGGALERSWSAGAGASIGFVGSLTGRWKAHLYGRDIVYGLGDEDNRFEAGLGQNLVLGANSGLAGEVTVIGERDETRVEWSVLLKQFF
ncbi:MAG: DUF4105 domain-containing protein [Candidatus Eisenbacteria bacterium]|nr:DUF4105 domain-containing protein [Candidatus Eisenbacteria bacterium]